LRYVKTLKSFLSSFYSGFLNHVSFTSLSEGVLPRNKLESFRQDKEYFKNFENETVIQQKDFDIPFSKDTLSHFYYSISEYFGLASELEKNAIRFNDYICTEGLDYN
jgi:hypothetical protein